MHGHTQLDIRYILKILLLVIHMISECMCVCACVYLLMDHSIKAEIFVAFIENKGYVYAVLNGMCHIYTYTCTSTPSLCVCLSPSLPPSLPASLPPSLSLSHSYTCTCTYIFNQQFYLRYINTFHFLTLQLHFNN